VRALTTHFSHSGITADMYRELQSMQSFNWQCSKCTSVVQAAQAAQPVQIAQVVLLPVGGAGDVSQFVSVA
jgi:hypothetical protein